MGCKSKRCASRKRKKSTQGQHISKFWLQKHKKDDMLATSQTTDSSISVDSLLVSNDEVDDLLEANTDGIKDVIYPTTILKCRRLVRLPKFIEDIRRIERHTSECSFQGQLIHIQTIEKGLAADLRYQCSSSLCSVQETISTENPESINFDAALASTAIGIGYSQCEEFMAAMDSPFMSNKTFSKYEQMCGTLIDSVEADQILETIDKERNNAILNNNVTAEGIPCITIIVDGCWCRRTYGHGYKSKSGNGILIGGTSKKVIFVGVRNKYCTICRMAQKQNMTCKEHHCNANWTGSSTSMEADIIVEGLNWLYTEHNVICTTLVGDGDSSVISAVRERVLYASMYKIEKIECANHAVRCMRKKLDKAADDAKQFPGKEGLQARRFLKSKCESLTASARATISKHETSKPTNIKISLLKDELKAVPYHTFGDHSKCLPGLSCTTDETNYVPILCEVGMMMHIDEIIFRLASMSNSLIYNMTNNPAECFMNNVAKMTGGKRVDFSRSASYNRRVKVACLSYNMPGQAWYEMTDKKRYRTVRGEMQNLMRQRRKKLQKERQRKRVRHSHFQHRNGSENHADLDYGASDVPDDQLAEMCKEFYKHKVCASNERIKSIELTTRMQSKSTLWHEERMIRVTASFVKVVAMRRPSTLCASLVRTILYPRELQSDAVCWGKEKEDVAKKVYERLTCTTVQECGLVIDRTYPFLAASPDGIVKDEDLSYIVEIKCPYVARNYKTIEEASSWVQSRAPRSKEISLARRLQVLAVEFTRQTTIPGFSHLSNRDNTFIAKTVWVGLLLGMTLSSVALSYHLIIQYQRYPIIETSVRDLRLGTPMPAITVCVNNPFRWNESLGPRTQDIIDEVNAVTNGFPADMKSIPKYYKTVIQARDQKLIEVLSGINETERYNLGFNRSTFLLGCQYGGETCNESDFIDFNNLWFGNCFTYNSGLNSATTKVISRDKDLVMVFRTLLDDSAPFLVRDNGPVLRLHMPKTAPMLHQSQLFVIYPSCWVRTPLTSRYFERLPPPYMSQCVEDEEPIASFARRPDLPYIYSSEDCTETCIQNRSLTLCQCYDPKFPIPQDLSLNFTVCPDGEQCAFDVADVETCNCRKSCREIMYDYRPDIDDRWLQQEVWQMWVTDLLRLPDSDKWKTKQYGMSGIEMYLASSMIESFYEEEKITLSDFMAAIGGNLGLWVGVSMMSLAEVCELALQTVMEVLKDISANFRKTTAS